VISAAGGHGCFWVAAGRQRATRSSAVNDTAEVQLSLKAEPESVAAAREAVATLAERTGAAAATVHEMRLAVSEAVTNAIRHAYEDGAIDGVVRLVATVDDGEDPPQIVISVSDDGPGVLPRGDSPGLGLGLPLMSQMAHRIDITNNHPGATVCMRFVVS
jgi:serine/threonine-protein kinase RsbW/stage II sporulation protein AB (anti-sigma F factor)